MCWAFWMRRTDAGLTDEPVVADSGTNILPDNAAFLRALTGLDPVSWTGGMELHAHHAPHAVTGPHYCFASSKSFRVGVCQDFCVTGSV